MSVLWIAHDLLAKYLVECVSWGKGFVKKLLVNSLWNFLATGTLLNTSSANSL